MDHLAVTLTRPCCCYFFHWRYLQAQTYEAQSDAGDVEDTDHTDYVFSFAMHRSRKRPGSWEFRFGSFVAHVDGSEFSGHGGHMRLTRVECSEA